MSDNTKQKALTATDTDGLDRQGIFTLIKADYESALPAFNAKNDRILRYRRVYEDEETKDTVALKGKSAYRSKVFKKKLRSIVPSIAQPILSSTSLYSVDIISVKSQIEAELHTAALLNTQFSRIPNRNLMVNSAAKRYAVDGTCIIKADWLTVVTKKKVTKAVPIYPQTEQELRAFVSKLPQEQAVKFAQMAEQKGIQNMPIGFDKTEAEETVVEVNRPNYKEVDTLRVMTDPSAKGKPENMKFLIEFLDMNMATLKADKRYFNLNTIALDDSGHDSGGDKFVQEALDEIGEGNNAEELAARFDYSDKARKKLQVKEYWGKVPANGTDGPLVAIVAAWSGDTLIRLEKTPMPHKDIPYAFGSYEPLEYSVFGESDAVIVEDDQTGVTTSMRAMQNITLRGDDTQEFIETGFLVTEQQKSNYARGKTVFYKKGADPSRAIFRRSIDPVPDVVFQMKEGYSGEIDTALGALGNMQPTQNNNGSPYFTEADIRQKSVVGRFADMWEQLGKFTASMNHKFILSSDTIKIGANKHSVMPELIIDPEDMHLSVSTVTEISKKVSGIMTLMNTPNGQMSPAIAGLHYAKIAALEGDDDLAFQIIEDSKEKPPTPQEQHLQEMEMKQAELDLKKTELELARINSGVELDAAKVEELIARALERNANVESRVASSQAMLNRGRTHEALALAEKLEAQTQLFSQQFNLEDTGEKRSREKLDAEYTHATNLEREEVRTERELTMLERKKDANGDGKVTKEESDDYLLDYIKQGTLQNDSYDAVGDVYRNIAEKGHYNSPQSEQ